MRHRMGLTLESRKSCIRCCHNIQTISEDERKRAKLRKETPKDGRDKSIQLRPSERWTKGGGYTQSQIDKATKIVTEHSHSHTELNSYFPLNCMLKNIQNIFFPLLSILFLHLFAVLSFLTKHFFSSASFRSVSFLLVRWSWKMVLLPFVSFIMTSFFFLLYLHLRPHALFSLSLSNSVASFFFPYSFSTWK